MYLRRVGAGGSPACFPLILLQSWTPDGWTAILDRWSARIHRVLWKLGTCLWFLHLSQLLVKGPRLNARSRRLILPVGDPSHDIKGDLPPRHTQGIQHPASDHPTLVILRP